MKANDVIQRLDEFLSLSHYGASSAKEIEDEFLDKLDSFGFSNIGVSVVLDLDEGPFVTFFDEEGDEVTIWFGVEDDQGPLASVVSEDDEQITILLDPFDPGIMEIGDDLILDLADLSWLNKSVLNALLMAGEVDSGGVEEAIAQVSVMRGKGKQKLPIIVKKDAMSDKDKLRVDKAKDLGLKTATNKKFAAKVKGGGK